MKAESGDRAAGADKQGRGGGGGAGSCRRSAGVISTRKPADLSGEMPSGRPDGSVLTVSLVARAVDGTHLPVRDVGALLTCGNRCLVSGQQKYPV